MSQTHIPLAHIPLAERPVKVWDGPTRLFHWAIVLLVFASWATAQFNLMGWHVWSGYAIFILLVFRVLWGIVGSDTARFTWFLRSPVAAFHHLRVFHRREPDTEIGHNAAGGWMVLLLLALLGLQVATGLYANDQAMTEGPFAELVGQDTSDWLTHIHRLTFTALEIAVALHVLAIAAYMLIRRHDLVRPMITGFKRLPDGVRTPRMRNPVMAAACLAVAIGVVVYVIRTYGVS